MFVQLYIYCLLTKSNNTRHIKLPTTAICFTYSQVELKLPLEKTAQFLNNKISLIFFRKVHRYFDVFINRVICGFFKTYITMAMLRMHSMFRMVLIRMGAYPFSFVDIFDSFFLLKSCFAAPSNSRSC